MNSLRGRLQRALKSAPGSAGELPQVTGTVRRLARAHSHAPVASFVFSSPTPVFSVSPVFLVETQGEFHEKEFVCEAIPQGEDGAYLPSQDSSWSFSESLGSAYAYVPAFSGDGQITLKPFKLESGFHRLTLVVRRWQSSTSTVPVAITACMSSGLVVIEGSKVPVYRAASRASNGR